MTYKIVRVYQVAGLPARILKTGLSLEEAREHCPDPETSSRTATSPSLVALTAAKGQWFDGYEEESS